VLKVEQWVWTTNQQDNPNIIAFYTAIKPDIFQEEHEKFDLYYAPKKIRKK
jgi:hypothetical protein